MGVVRSLWWLLPVQLGAYAGYLSFGFIADRLGRRRTFVLFMIAAAVLFFIGSGPVRGFALTLGIGIITTVFTAFTLTRLMIAAWFRWFRPRTIPI